MKQKLEACDVPDKARKKQKTLDKASSRVEKGRMSRYGGYHDAESFAPQDIGNVAYYGQPLSEPHSAWCVAFNPAGTSPD